MPGEIYDAIVVGAGPAGCAAAFCLARAGCRILLLEKAGPGRAKPCAGGLTPRAYEGLEVPIDDLVRARSSAVDLWLGRQPIATVRAPGTSIWMVHRADLDSRLAEGAASQGASLRFNEPALRVCISPHIVAVDTSEGTHRAAALLIATGASRRPQLSPGIQLAPLIPATALSLEIPARLEAHQPAILDYGVPGGYCWAFPKGECWSAGIMARHPPNGRFLRFRLAQFLSGTGLAPADFGPSQLQARGAVVPLWKGWHPLTSGRVALLGDAGALADPFFGEGISCALVSGRLGAAAVLEMLEGNAPDLSSYGRALRATLGRHLQHQRTLAALVYRVPALSVHLLARMPFFRRLAIGAASRPFLP